VVYETIRLYISEVLKTQYAAVNYFHLLLLQL